MRLKSLDYDIFQILQDNPEIPPSAIFLLLIDNPKRREYFATVYNRCQKLCIEGYLRQEGRNLFLTERGKWILENPGPVEPDRNGIFTRIIRFLRQA